MRRFNRVIHVVDSTTIQLVAACMDWAKHRRRKAAAKCHLRLDLQSFLPRFAIVDTAKHHDNKRAREVCAGGGSHLRIGRQHIDDRQLVARADVEVRLVVRGRHLEHTRAERKIHMLGEQN